VAEGDAVKSIEVEVRGPAGLHARPAAAFVKAAGGFRSTVRLENLTLGGGPVDARSLTAVLAAGVEQGHRVRVAADGPDEVEALAVLRPLLDAAPGTGDDRAGEPAADDSDREPGGASPAAQVGGLPGAPGLAIGPVWLLADEPATAGEPVAASPEKLIRESAAAAAAELEALAGRLRDAGRPGDAGILEAQALMAVDPAVVEVAVRLATAGLQPAAAIVAAAEASARAMAGLRDELLAARAADVRDVGSRIARIATGAAAVLPDRPSIVVARDVPPSIVVEAPPGLLMGLALEGGSPASHLAILARGLGIPAVVAAQGLLAAAGRDGGISMLALDGCSGEILLDPDEASLAALRGRQSERDERGAKAASLRGRPGATSDGRRIALLANIRSPEDAPRALSAGAEGVGLFRTEYLFLRRHSAPGEEEQVEAYRQAMEAFGPERPVVIRLADIGGDKEMPYLGLPEEPNPFLGVRAIRLAHGSRELLLTQLRAIWRAGGLAGVTPHVMAAMVSTLADARLLAELRDEARAAVEAAGQQCAERMVTGLMIEVPSAAALAPELARLADFFSIGTNDLTQYVLAADRGNPSLARLQDALHPAVLRTIAAVVGGAAAAGIPVAACGELAGDPAGALVLAGLGVGELSADPAALDAVRAVLAGVTAAELRELADRALAATDAETVRTLAAPLLDR
jgi:phosphoenolpyruvate-protein phosphotransferase